MFHTLEGWSRILHGNKAAAEAWPNGAAGVDLFFVISGLVMMISASRRRRRPADWRVFLRSRLERIVPLYWLFSGLKLLQMLAAPGWAPHSRVLGWNAVATFLFIPARDATGAIYPLVAVGWSLNFEMFFYALFAVAIAAGGSPLRTILPPLVVLSALGVFRPHDWPAPTGLASTLLLEFCMGALIGQALRAQWRLPPLAAAGLSVVGFALLSCLPHNGTWQGLVWGVPAAAVVWGVVSLERLLATRLPAVWLGIGDASYAIYLVHGLTVAALMHAILAHPSLADAPLPAVVAAALASSVMAGWLVHVAIEKPIMSWLRRRRWHRSPLVAAT